MADENALSSSYINPVTGDPMTPEEVAGQGGMLKSVGGYLGHVAQGIGNLASTPGAAMQPNPYPPGSEEAAWYDHQRQQGIAQWGPQMATAMIGAGTPLSVEGAAGAAGGRLAAVRNPITGKLQVAPNQALTDAFISGGPPVEATAYVPQRANGRFANTRDAGRAAVLTPEKITAPDVLRQPNVMYDPANPPAPFVSRAEAPQQAAPADLQRSLSKMPNSFIGETEKHILKNYGMAGLAMLPPATAAFLSQRMTPVDHDPFGGT